MESFSSTSTIAAEASETTISTTGLDLSTIPPILVLTTRLDNDELHKVEGTLIETGAPLTYDVFEAKIFLTKMQQKRRIAIELRALGLWTEDASVLHIVEASNASGDSQEPARKRIRTEKSVVSVKNVSEEVHEDDSSTESEAETVADSEVVSTVNVIPSLEASFSAIGFENTGDTVKAVAFSWLEDCLEARKLLPFNKYLVYEGKRVSRTTPPDLTQSLVKHLDGDHSDNSAVSIIGLPPRKPLIASDILARAQADAPPPGPGPSRHTPAYVSTTQRLDRGIGRQFAARVVHLVHETTSEHDDGASSDIPEPPDWVRRRGKYSCERSTPMTGPNDAFIKELVKIRFARKLTDDEIGVRAYSTFIAALAAYPYTITSAREILALPGCDNKLAILWCEFKNNNGYVESAHQAEHDERLQVMSLFYEIWGVGSHTARHFYDNKGWRDLDDVVEFGWNDLSRVQQIGLKFYDDFQVKIPRTEVEFIAAKIHEHAQRVREPEGVRTCIVGGYRRGKAESGDVDVILSHTDDGSTLGLVDEIVSNLTEEGWITHDLKTTQQNTRREQATLPFRAGGGGHGFDSLDKAMVVWQNPTWPGKDSAEPGVKNPNVHRRVDIIIAPWSKVGCAVMGWTNGITFQRDLRRYAKHIKGWKFDSSGVRDRVTGEEIDLENVGGRCTTVEEAEKKVFAGFGLVWREPWERCTG